jgi:hypothetical protein
MSKLNQILIGIVALQIAITAFVFWPQPAPSNAASLLPEVTATNVIQITLNDENDNTLTLAKNGDKWVMPAADDFPVKGEQVTTLLGNIEEIKTNRPVTRTESSHKQLKVAGDDFTRRIELETQDGTKHTFYVGTSAGAGATHVRVEGQAEVYLAASLNSFDVNVLPSSWIDTLYPSVPQAEVVGVTLENKNGTFEFAKDGDAWTLLDLAEGETFNETNFTGLLNVATSLRMTAPLGKSEQPSFGLAEPQAVVTLKTSGENGEKTYSLQIGAKTEDNAYIAKSSESPYYVTVAEFTGANFVDKTRDDFLQAPPTPTEEPGE